MASSGTSGTPAIEVWLARYASYPPTPTPPAHWDDNPPSVRLLSRVESVDAGLGAAREFCREFNGAECDRPIGLWALILASGAGRAGAEVPIVPTTPYRCRCSYPAGPHTLDCLLANPEANP